MAELLRSSSGVYFNAGAARRAKGGGRGTRSALGPSGAVAAAAASPRGANGGRLSIGNTGWTNAARAQLFEDASVPALVEQLGEKDLVKLEHVCHHLRYLSASPTVALELCTPENVPVLLELMRVHADKRPRIVTHVVAALYYATRDSDAARVVRAAPGIAEALDALLRSEHHVQRQLAAQVLCALFPADELAVTVPAAPVLRLLIGLLGSGEPSVARLAMGVLEAGAYDVDAAASMCVEGLCAALVELLASVDPALQRDALALLRNVSTNALAHIDIRRALVGIAAEARARLFPLYENAGAGDEVRELAEGVLWDLGSIASEHAAFRVRPDTTQKQFQRMVASAAEED